MSDNRQIKRPTETREQLDTKTGPIFGAWAHLGWKLPDHFDDPDPEIEALFYGEPNPGD